MEKVNMTAVFVDANGIALAMDAMKTFQSDGELVWHVIGLLNGLNTKGIYNVLEECKLKSFSFSPDCFFFL